MRKKEFVQWVILLRLMLLILFFKLNICQACPITLDSCDIIVTLSGDEIKSKVVEVGEIDIKYRKCEFQSGPLYSIRKSDVFMIKYSNGSKDVFGKKASNPPNDKDDNAVKSNTEEQQKIKITIFYPGKKILVGKAVFDVYWDGTFIGEMSFKKGGQVEVYTTEGPHRLKIRTTEYRINIDADNKDNHYIQLKYDGSLGEILLDKKK